jgi:hypothetical protein
MKSLASRIVLLAATVFAAACGFQHQSSVTAPSSATSGGGSSQVTAAMVGAWSSQAPASVPAIPDPKSCGNFVWTVTSQTTTSIAGTFTVSCDGGLSMISGSGSGTLANSTTLNISASGSGSMPGIPSCNFSLTSTATISDNNTTLTIPYTGTTCLGPVHGTETLHRHTETSAPPPAPAPAPAPAPVPPPTPSGPTDAIDLHQAIITGGSPGDIADWPITTQITGMDFGNGVRIDFSKKDGPGRWPDVTPPGWDGPLQYTAWMVVNVGGQWYTSGGVEFWYGLDRSGGPASQFAYNWYYSPQVWGPLANQQPANGEMTGFFVSAGDARAKDVHAVRERSNVVALPFPSGGGFFSFSAGRLRR